MDDQTIGPHPSERFPYGHEKLGELRDVLKTNRPDLLAEFDDITESYDLRTSLARFLDHHFPEHRPWGLEDPRYIPRLVRELTSSRP